MTGIMIRSNDFQSPISFNTHHRFKFTGRPSEIMGAISSPKYYHVIIKKRLNLISSKFNKLNLHKLSNTNENHNG